MSTPTTSNSHFEIFHSIAEIPTVDWEKLLPPHHFFLKPAYLRAFEAAHKSKMDFRYVVYYHNHQVAGVCLLHTLQIEGKSLRNDIDRQKEVSAWSKWWSKRLQNRINKLSLRLLICGNMMMTGEHGYYFKDCVPPAKRYALLEEAIAFISEEEAAKGNRFHGIMIKDFEEAHIEEAQTLTQFAYKEVMGEPCMQMEVPWDSFDDYLQAMSSKYRVRAKKVLKKGKSLERRELSYEELVVHNDHLYSLYRKIADQASFNIAIFDKEYMPCLKKELGDQFKVIAYYQDDKIIGFTSNFVAGDLLEAHFIGYYHEHNRPFAIYNNILYDIIHLAIDNQCSHISFGRTAPEIKSTVGAKAHAMPVFYRHNNAITNRFIVPLVNRFREDNYILRSPFKN